MLKTDQTTANAKATKKMFEKKLYYRRWWNKVGFGRPPANRFATLQEYSKLIATLAKPQSLILEVGCGRGYGLQMLRSEGCTNLVGIDLAKVFMQAENTDFLVAEATHLPLRQDLLDIIFARKFVDTTDVKGCLKEFRGTLRDEGKLVIEVPNVKRLASRIYRALGLEPKYDARYFPHLNRASFQNLLCKSGFMIQRIRGDYIDIPAIGNALSRLSHGMLPRTFGRIRPNLCLHLMAVCSKKQEHDEE